MAFKIYLPAKLFAWKENMAAKEFYNEVPPYAGYLLLDIKQKSLSVS
jgi:hypothetical protein